MDISKLIKDLEFRINRLKVCMKPIKPFYGKKGKLIIDKINNEELKVLTNRIDLYELILTELK